MPLTDILAAVRWWAILMVLGTAVVPVAFHLLRPLPDRGYAFVKMIGLLLVGYLFWMLGSLGFLQNNVGGMLFALALVLLLSAWAWRQIGGDLLAWLRDNRGYVIVVELLFLLIFAAWVWVRAQNPAIEATEKPMEFAFLNAVSRSPTFPPLDPWLSGYAISYYYFGYVMMSLLARLAVVPEAVAFNLGIAWLVAGTAVGAFGVVYNLVAGDLTQRRRDAEEIRGVGVRRAAMALGVVAALALPIAGNQQIVLEVAHANGIGSAHFWEWLNVRDINTPPPQGDTTPRYETGAWWWWRASRPINEHSLAGQPVEGLEPIAEFPGFSFVLGDMHPHVLALPFALLSLAVAFALMRKVAGEQGGKGARENSPPLLRPSAPPPTFAEAGWLNGTRALIADVGWPLWAFTALLLGGLSFLNTWDVLIHLFVVLGAYLLARWRRDGWENRLLGKTAVLAVTLIIPAILLYLPFYLGFSSQAGAPYLLPTLVRPTRLPQFLIIFGMPLWALTIFIGTLAAKQRFRHGRAAAITAVALIGGLLLLALLLGWIIAASPDGAGRIINLANELGIALPPRPEGSMAAGWGVTAVFAVLPAILRAKLQYPGTTLLLTALISLSVMALINLNTKTQSGKDAEASPPPLRPSAPLLFLLLLTLTGALLTLGPEFVYLRDNFGFRLNTIFKFYYQAWVMFGVAAIAALYYLWDIVADGAARLAAPLATAGYALMFALALLFPYYAVHSRAIEYRGAPDAAERLPATLDGMAKMARFNPDDYDAIMWLRENAEENPVVLEATGGAYSYYGRVSANSGLPTVLGWANHQYQWRGSDTPEPGAREPAIRDIYSRPNWDDTGRLLNEYDVRYVYVGPLERSTYGVDGRLPGEEKFQERLEVAYQNNSVTIYRWHPE